MARLSKITLAAFAAVLTGLAAPVAVQAAPTGLALVDVIAGQEVGQQAARPCIFGDRSCDAGKLGTFTDITTTNASTTHAATVTTAQGVSAYDATSTYTVQSLIDALGGSKMFNIGIDLNTTSAMSETLQYFNVYLGADTTGSLIYQYQGPTQLGLAVDLKNGIGWSDWMLQTIDLSGYDPSASITFSVGLTGDVAGAEQFFLVAVDPTTSPGQVPEPASLALVGLGLAAAGAGALRRRQRKA